MNDHFVCVEINASHQQGADELARATYNTKQGWPTFICADPSDTKKSFAHSGYLPPAEFLEWLQKGTSHDTRAN